MTSLARSRKAASDEVLAQGILEKYASAEAHPDESLGSYLVSLLREQASEEDNAEPVVSSTALDHLDQDLKESMLELLEEHCCVERDVASQVLYEIYCICQSRHLQVTTTISSSPSPILNALSPTQATLIPNDLLGEIVGSESDSVGYYHGYYQEQSVTPGRAGSATSVSHVSIRSTDDTEFPPLGAASTSSKMKGKRSSLAESPTYDTIDPARSRESSLDETITSHSTNSTPLQQPQHAPANLPSYDYQTQYYDNQQQQPDQPSYEDALKACVDYLLAMNAHLPLSRSAAINAAVTADSDPSMAQYLIDMALAAPPVCRHFLDKGCYRADCSYSHTIGVCLFWIKGSCRWRPGECQFQHEFDPQVVQDALAAMEQEAMAANAYPELGSEAYYPEDGYLEGGYDNNTRLEMEQQQDPALASSFAAIATLGYSQKSFANASSSFQQQQVAPSSIPTVPIPQDLWNPHENRDSSVFFIDDPMDRYVQASKSIRRNDVIDLHFQSIKTFPVVLSRVLPSKFENMSSVWIVTGTGHHVGSQTHQKGGGALEMAVMEWLQHEGYQILRGRDRNGKGGAILVRL